jgi:hypothetical protein
VGDAAAATLASWFGYFEPTWCLFQVGFSGYE